MKACGHKVHYTCAPDGLTPYWQVELHAHCNVNERAAGTVYYYCSALRLRHGSCSAK